MGTLGDPRQGLIGRCMYEVREVYGYPRGSYGGHIFKVCLQ